MYINENCKEKSVSEKFLILHILIGNLNDVNINPDWRPDLINEINASGFSFPAGNADEVFNADEGGDSSVFFIFAQALSSPSEKFVFLLKDNYLIDKTGSFKVLVSGLYKQTDCHHAIPLGYTEKDGWYLIDEIGEPQQIEKKDWPSSVPAICNKTIITWESGYPSFIKNGDDPRVEFSDGNDSNKGTYYLCSIDDTRLKNAKSQAIDYIEKYHQHKTIDYVIIWNKGNSSEMRYYTWLLLLSSYD